MVKDDQKSLKNIAIKNFMWRFAERSGAQFVSFIVSIILARLLSPSDYGIVAIVTIFVNVLQVFTDSGLANALIQKQEVDEADYSSVFLFNITICVILYIVLFLGSPIIAHFYGEERLTKMIRVSGIILVISGIKNVQQAYISRNMLFRIFFFSTIVGTVISAAIGIGLAFYGVGAWALIFQQLSNSMIDTVILWCAVRWKPKRRFSLKRLKILLRFGIKLLITGMLDALYNNLRSLLIGKVYSEIDLAYYNKGKQFPQLIMNNINTSLNSILFPVLSSNQKQRERIKQMTKRSIRLSSYILIPAMVGLAVIAEPLVKLLLTEKWLLCVPYFRIFCFIFALTPINTANLNAIAAMGEMNIYLRLAFVEKIIGLLGLMFVYKKGVLEIAYIYLITVFITTLCNTLPNKKLMNYSVVEQFQDIILPVIMSIVMGICIFPIQYIKINVILIIFLQMILGIGIYLGISFCIHYKEFNYLISVIRKD